MEQSDAERNAIPPHIDEGTAHAWLDGALSPEEAEHVRVHAASCAECGAVVAEARGLIAASSRIVTALDDVPGGVLPSVTRAAARRQQDGARLVPPPAVRRMPWWARGLAAAASLVVVTGTVLRLSGGADGADGAATIAGSHQEPASDTTAAGPYVAGTASAASAAPSGAPSVVAAPEGAVASRAARTPPPSPVVDAAGRAASIGAAARMERSRAANVAPQRVETRELALQDRAADAAVSAKAAASPPAAPVVPPAGAPAIAAQRAAAASGASGASGAGAGGGMAGSAAPTLPRAPVPGEVAAAEARFLADASARRAQGLAFAPGTIERRAGCYTISRGGASTASPAPPSAVRLTDTALAPSPTSWLRARLVGSGSGALAWTPIDSSRAMLRVSAPGDTSTFLIAFAPPGHAQEQRAASGEWIATRIDCR